MGIRTRKTDAFKVRADDGREFDLTEWTSEKEVSTIASTSKEWESFEVVLRLTDGTEVDLNDDGTYTVSATPAFRVRRV